MARAVILAALLAITSQPLPAQTTPTGVLHIKVAVADPARKLIPVPRHALLISDNPATSAPRRVVTGIDGTVDVRLRAGNYTVESEQAVSLFGKGYEWTQDVDIAAGAEATLELTDRNADSVAAPLPSSGGAPDRPSRVDPSALLTQWNGSLVRLWTDTSRSSGFVVDARGLIVTSRHAVGDASSLEVQSVSATKVEGRVLLADAERDLAVVWVNPAAIGDVRPLAPSCSDTAKSLEKDDEILALGLPVREQHDRLSYGLIRATGPNAIETDARLEAGAAGGPVFTNDGRLVGVTTLAAGDVERRGETRVVPIADVCELVASAAQKMQQTPVPAATRLPVEPDKPFPPAALKELAKQRAGNLNPYQMTAAEFTVSFITPFMVYAAHDPDRHTTSRDMRLSSLDQARLPSPTEFGNWSEYVEDYPPVLLIRVTPKLSESFWASVARGAAMTQGVAIPAIKRFKGNLSRMRVYCGDTEVTPIHPFALETEVASGETVREGLYVFDPSSLGPHCGSVK
jgi:S1-C subfamily serine protease